MKRLALMSLGLMTLSTGAIAQQYNGFPPPEPQTGNIENTEPLLGFPRRGESGQRTALERIQALCASDSERAMQRCARVKQAMETRLANLNAGDW